MLFASSEYAYRASNLFAFSQGFEAKSDGASGSGGRIQQPAESVQTMHENCLFYLCNPSVRAVILLKYFPRPALYRSRFEAVAVLYSRGPRGAPEVADAVSFDPFPSRHT
jgi:hypothetical protein